MKELFIKHKTVIIRTLGILMLLVGFLVQFWTTPKKGWTENEIAAQNVARMEARIQREMGGGSKQKKPEPSSSEMLKHLKDAQAAQQMYLTIIAMLLGIGFLGYSFVNKKEGD